MRFGPNINWGLKGGMKMGVLILTPSYRFIGIIKNESDGQRHGVCNLLWPYIKTQPYVRDSPDPNKNLRTIDILDDPLI
jgi:hypothetical protein